MENSCFDFILFLIKIKFNNNLVMSESSPQIDPKVYQLVQEKNFREMMKKLQINEVMDFMSKFPEMLRPSDKEKSKAALRSIGIYLAGGLLVGIGLNVSMKKILPSAMTMPTPQRFALRAFFLMTPCFIGYRLLASPKRK